MIHQRRPPQSRYFKRHFPNWGAPNKAVYHFFISTLFLNTLIFGPFIYLINQNFNFFQGLAIDSSPTLLTHLDREQTWFNILSFTLLVIFAVTNWWFAMKILRNFRGQMHALDRHLRHLIRGEWFTPPLKVRKNDDFKDVVEQYGYFYKSLQAMTKAEVHLLEKMKIDPSQRETYTIWKTLLQQKKARLGHEEIMSENARAAEFSHHWKKSV